MAVDKFLISLSPMECIKNGKLTASVFRDGQVAGNFCRKLLSLAVDTADEGGQIVDQELTQLLQVGAEVRSVFHKPTNTEKLETVQYNKTISQT